MKRFDLITEADARVLDHGSTVELTAGGHVTPLARDTLAARRVTVVAAGSTDATLPPDLAPVSDVRRVAIGSDHSGVALKKALVGHLRGKGLAVTDLGTDSAEPVDYPDIAAAVARAVARGEADAGIVHRRRRNRLGDCREQGPWRARGDVPGRDDRPLFARAQRGQRDHARLVAAGRA